MEEKKKTPPLPRFPKDFKPDPSTLAAGRYGTQDMVETLGPERTFQYGLDVQGHSASTLSSLHQDIIPSEHADDLHPEILFEL